MSVEFLAVDILACERGEVEVRPTDHGVALCTDARMGLAVSLHLSAAQAERLARALGRAARISTGEAVG